MRAANGVPTTTAPSGLCRAGPATAVTGSGPWYWQCKGQKGGNTASCSAPLAQPSPPPPTLTLTISPLSPNISASASLGTYVATVTAAWSDGSPFTGTIQFTAPYYDDGGTIALSGNQLIISPLGLGINGDGGSTQHVSLVAVQ